MTEPAPSDEMPLPFPHGIEVELQVVRRDGTWLRGQEVLEAFDRIIANAKTHLDRRIRTSGPRSVREKYRHSSQTEEGERGSRVVASYRDPEGVYREYTLVGHDPNVTSLTWILEIATPPCTTIEELAWWTQTLVAISYESIPTDSPIILISTGLNPTQDYLKNLSFGEHHHILGPQVDDRTRLAVYNMIRNFIPHLVALTVNSPFENKTPTDVVSVDSKGNTRAPKCKRSIRLMKNTTQLGPTSEFDLIPYMQTLDKDAFAKHVNRSPARMVDMYPFTRFGTIEIRVFDTQLSVPRRVGIALLLQSLALRAKRMVERGEAIPDVGARCLAANRESAVSAGLWGAFRASDASDASGFITTYNSQIDDNGEVTRDRRNRYLGDAIVSMLHLIRDEIEELRLIDNPFMQPILVSVFGSDYHEAKTTGADFQLDVYAKSDMNMVVLLRKLTDITRECCTNWLYDPLEGSPHLPTWLCWWSGVQPEIVVGPERVFAGQEAEFSITLRNATPKSITNLSITYTVEDSARNVVTRNVIPIVAIQSGEVHVSSVRFRTRPDTTAYNIIASVLIAGREIGLTGTLHTYWTRISARAGSTTQLADGRSPVLFTAEIETNLPKRTECACRVEVLALAREQVLTSVERTLFIEAGTPLGLDHTSFPKMILPPHLFEGIERCALRVSLLGREGQMLAAGTSKPFYVAFTPQAASLAMRVVTAEKHNPGDVVRGEIELRTRGKPLSRNSRLSVVFRADSGRTERILSEPASILLAGPAKFEWQVPLIVSDNPLDRMGTIVATLADGEHHVVTTESQRLQVLTPEIRLSIERLSAPEASSIGGRIAGWLMIRRSHEGGEPSQLTLTLRFPNGEEVVFLRQDVKQSRNLSLAYGPLVIPSPSDGSKPSSVELVATLSYQGLTLDSKSARIQLIQREEEQLAHLEIVGLRGYIVPDETLNAALNVTNNSSVPVTGRLLVALEAVTGRDVLVDHELSIGPEETRTVPVPVSVPLSSEMSTAQISALFESGSRVVEKKYRLKIKAIEAQLFEVSFSLKTESGTEIPGLVPRATPVRLITHLRMYKGHIQDLSLLLRIMSKREVVKEYEVLVEPSAELTRDFTVLWTTPAVDVVTSFYLDVVILHRSRPIPRRSISVMVKQFTVY
ncbi:MAG: hypothetical protein HXY34_04970 [Candidatus Thorarchaeota archaeon]|nr:hypothetical protein [Candidatus Thorarchaeota archaeon]